MIPDVAAIVSMTAVISTGLWWIYRRGQASGWAQAKREADRREMAQRLAKLEAEREPGRISRRRL
jgi:hypothetical protein